MLLYIKIYNAHGNATARGEKSTGAQAVCSTMHKAKVGESHVTRVSHRYTVVPTISFCTIVYCTMLFDIILYCIITYHNTLYYNISYSIMSHHVISYHTIS